MYQAAELAKVESIVESLRDELSAAQRSSRDQRDQVARLQEQLRTYQDKNNVSHSHVHVSFNLFYYITVVLR